MQRPPNIETERLVLFALLPEDIEALMAGEWERLSRQTGFTFQAEDPKLGVDLAWHLRWLRSDSRHLPWRIRVIVERASNTVVGSINLKGPPDNSGDVEIGWGVIERARKKGYAAEASAAVIRWAVQQADVKIISATIPDDNEASQRLATRLGLVRTDETRRNLPLWKCDRDCLPDGGVMRKQ